MVDPAKTSAVLPSQLASVDDGHPPIIAEGPRLEPAEPAAPSSHQGVEVPSMVLETLPGGPAE
jgi:hypothetical protein